jgi:hypothetical protein
MCCCPAALVSGLQLGSVLVQSEQSGTLIVTAWGASASHAGVTFVATCAVSVGQLAGPHAVAATAQALTARRMRERVTGSTSR